MWLENRCREGASRARHLLGKAFEINLCGKEGRRRKQDWVAEKLSCGASQERLPSPQGNFGVGRPFRAVQVGSRGHVFISELNSPRKPLEGGMSRQRSFLQQRKTPKAVEGCWPAALPAPWVSFHSAGRSGGLTAQASEHFSSLGWLPSPASGPFVCTSCIWKLLICYFPPALPA